MLSVSGAHKIGTEAAAEAIFAIAVVLFQLEQRLRVGRMSRSESRFVPSPHRRIAFRPQLLEPFERTCSTFVVMVCTRVGK